MAITDIATTERLPNSHRSRRGTLVAMPDYTAEIEYAAPEFGGAEFRMLRRQLVPLLADVDGVTAVRVDKAARTIHAGLSVTAASSSSARAKAASRARAVHAHLRRVRTGRIVVRVELRELAEGG
jgi:hypothetical protein